MEKTSRTQKIFIAVFFVLFALYAISLIFPFIWCLICSFKSANEFISGNIWGFPKVWYFDNWARSFNMTANGLTIPEMYLNSAIFTVGCTVLSVMSSACTAYVLTKYNFKGKSFFYSFALVIMMIPSMGSMAALYKMYNDLHLIDTYIGIFIMSMGGFGTAFLLLYGYFRNLSWTYAEAAFVDGAGHFRIFFTIMLPMSIPALVAVGILQAIGFWNDYFTIYMYAQGKSTIAVGLQVLSANQRSNPPLLFAAMMFSVLPILIVFACFQKTIMNNTAIGGIKG